MNADTRNLGRVSFLLGVIVAAFFGGTVFGRRYEHNSSLFGLSRAESFWGTSRSLIGSLKSYAQFEQDLWVVLATAPGKKNGFYVDLGSADGEHISNTKLLDELGWKGICIDPFPTNMERRTCAVFRQPVSNVSGTKVSFRTAGELGGIESNLGKHKSEVASAKTVELVTATLDEILAKGNAPRYIDYMSIDIEGAEYNALLSLSFDKYEIGAFTIEHNFETEKREAIWKLLTAKGYVRVRSWEVDDWYVHRNIASRYLNFLSYCSKPYCSDLL